MHTTTVKQVRTPDQMRAATYSRQSHASERSMQDQDVEMLTDADTIGVEVVEQFSDGKPASPQAKRRNPKLSRQDWELVQEAIKRQDIDMLVLWEASRGDRDAIEWLTFLKLCAENKVLIRVTVDLTTYDPTVTGQWEQLAQKGVRSEAETRVLSDRSKRGVRSSIRRGSPRCHIPFGYRREYERVGSRHEIRQLPDEELRTVLGAGDIVTRWSPAGVVRELYAEVRDGVSLRELSRRLERRGIPTPRQHSAAASEDDDRIEKWAETRWRPELIKRMLLRACYLGHLEVYERDEHGRLSRDADGKVLPPKIVARDRWPALVSQTDWDEVNSILRHPDRRGWSTNTVHLCSNIARAEKPCNGPLLHVTSGAGVASYQCMVDYCTGIRAAKLDAYVSRLVVEWLLKPGNLDLLRRSDEEVGVRVTEARAEVFGLTAKLDAHLALQDEDGFVGTVGYYRKEDDIRKEIAEAERRARSLVKLPAVKKLITATDIAQAWVDLTLTEKRSVIRLLTDIRVKRVGHGRRVDACERVTVVWRLGGSV